MSFQKPPSHQTILDDIHYNEEEDGEYVQGVSEMDEMEENGPSENSMPGLETSVASDGEDSDDMEGDDEEDDVDMDEVNDLLKDAQENQMLPAATHRKANQMQ